MAKKYLDYNGTSYFWGKLKTYFQAKLVSGTNIKTINNESILGSGNIDCVSDDSYVHTDNNYTTTEKNKLSGIASGAEANVQADWNETDSTADAYIANKPDIESLKTLVVTVPSFSSLPTTFYDSRITGDHVVNNWYLGTPSVMMGDHWDITTGIGQLTITGSISGSTTLTLHLGLKQAEEE